MVKKIKKILAIVLATTCVITCYPRTANIVYAETPSCTHENQSTSYTSTSDGNHNVVITCDDCLETISSSPEACSLDHGSWGTCSKCSYNVSCSHSNGTSSSIGSSNGDGTHVVNAVCNDCGTTLSSDNESCSLSNGTYGNCTCGYSVSCTHSSSTNDGDAIYTNGDCTQGGSQPKRCSDCGASMSPQTISPYESHAYSGGTCTRCGITQPICTHTNKTLGVITYTNNDCTQGGTQPWSCNDCSEVGSNTISAESTHNYVLGNCSRCGKTKPACSHTNIVNDGAVVYINNDCTQGGSQPKKCNDCGTPMSPEEIAGNTSHTFDTNGNCTNAGCSQVCEHSKEYGSIIYSTTNCIDNASKPWTCSICGKTGTESVSGRSHLWNNDGTCANCSTICSHNEKSNEVITWVNNDCTQGGTKTWECNDCHYLGSTPEPAKTHNFAGGTENTAGICDNCGKTCSEDHDALLGVGTIVWTDNDCTKGGVEETNHCSCGYYKLLPIVGNMSHSYDTNGDCTITGCSSTCPHNSGRTNEFDLYTENNCLKGGTHHWTCSVCNYEGNYPIEAQSSHNYVNGNCERCGMAEEQPCTHVGGVIVSIDWTNNDCKQGGVAHYSACTNCGETYDKVEEPWESHVYDTTTHKCKRCEMDCNHDSNTSTISITYTNNDCTQGGTESWVCNDCMYEGTSSVSPQTSHSLEEYSNKCALCGTITDHICTGTWTDADVTWKQGDCTKGGIIDFVCTKCGELKENFVIAAKASHNYSDGRCTICNTCEHKNKTLGTITYINNDCTQGGSQTFTCQDCSKIGTIDIASVPSHNFSNGYCTRCKTIESTGCTHEGGTIESIEWINNDCTKGGIAKYTACTKCSKKYAKQADANAEHTYTTFANKCDICGTISEHTHEGGKQVNKPKDCTKSGATIEYTNCSKCNESYTSSWTAYDKHDFKNKQCTRCEVKEQEKVCTHEEKKYERKDDDHHKIICNTCGVTINDNAECTFEKYKSKDEDSDKHLKQCKYCSNEKKEDHSFKYKYKEDNKHKKYCEKCDYEKKEDCDFENDKCKKCGHNKNITSTCYEYTYYALENARTNGLALPKNTITMTLNGQSYDVGATVSSLRNTANQYLIANILLTNLGFNSLLPTKTYDFTTYNVYAPAGQAQTLTWSNCGLKYGDIAYVVYWNPTKKTQILPVVVGIDGSATFIAPDLNGASMTLVRCEKIPITKAKK